MLLTLIVCGLDVGDEYVSFINVNDINFYKAHRALAKKMDAFDWLPRNYLDGAVEGEEGTLDQARRNVSTMLALPC